MSELLDAARLERSSVVANNAMNRNRGLAGVNSYTKELGFHPLDFLRERLAANGSASWLDLCCGSGRALVESVSPGIELVGVDLVDYFDPAPPESVTLLVESVTRWEPGRHFDLITCVHGLHYVGDKLGMLSRALSWLAPGGRFCGHLDLSAIRFDDGSSAEPGLRVLLRKAEVGFDARRRLVRCDGPRTLPIPHRYLGADATAGPNYTGQPAVASIYRRASA